MLKLGLSSLVAAALATLALVTVTADSADAAKPCARKKFDTIAVKEACAKGGQDQAKKMMKDWLKTAKKKTASMNCATCHSKVSGDYPLKKDGLKLYKDHGGK